jgi:transposase
LFPHLGSVELDQVEDRGDLVRLLARTRTSPVTCPECGEQATRVHDRYWRRLQDLVAYAKPWLFLVHRPFSGMFRNMATRRIK